MRFEQYFPISYPTDMDDLAITWSDFVNVLRMLICWEKHPVSRANYGYTKKVITDGWPTIETLSAEQFSASFDILYNILSPIIRFRD